MSETIACDSIIDKTVYSKDAALIGGGGGVVFIYSGSARLICFEIRLISKKISRAENEYMNIPPPINAVL